MDNNHMKVLLADDHDLIRQGTAQILNEIDPQIMVSEARDWDEALALARSDNDFALALLDMNMPGMSGMHGLQKVLSQAQTLPVAVLSASDEPQLVTHVINQGASGYIPKSAPVSVMRSALQLLLAGEMYIPSVMITGGGAVVARNGKTGGRSMQLTSRQHQVLGLVSQGHSNKRIATELGMAEATVKAHLNAIYRSLGVNSRVEAIRQAESMRK